MSPNLSRALAALRRLLVVSMLFGGLAALGLAPAAGAVGTTSPAGPRVVATATQTPSPTPTPAPAAPRLDWDVPAGHFYTQASGYPLAGSPLGYAITDTKADGVRFWSEFRRLGGVDRLGYPSSQRFLWQGFVCQATQKAVLQWRPELGQAYFVNVFDDLGAAGKNNWLSTVRSTPPPLSADFDGGRPWSQVVAGRLALLDARPRLAARYRTASDPLGLYGLPTSGVVDQGTHFAVRLQRAVLQEWKVETPWAHVGEVTVANGGDVGKEAGIFPASALSPVLPPAGTWRPAASEFSLTGTTSYYDSKFGGRRTASGLAYDSNDATIAAAVVYPLGTRLRVTSTSTRASIEVTVRDTGELVYPRLLDLSPAGFQKLGHSLGQGTAPVLVEVLATP